MRRILIEIVTILSLVIATVFAMSVIATALISSEYSWATIHYSGGRIGLSVPGVITALIPYVILVLWLIAHSKNMESDPE